MGNIKIKLPYDIMKFKKIISMAAATVFLFNAYTYSQPNQITDSLTTSVVAVTTANKPIISKVTSTYNSATVTWKKVSGATSYKVYMITTGQSDWKEVATVTGTKYTRTSLKAATPYYFSIRACVDGLWGDYSDCKDTVTPTKAPSISLVSRTSFSAHFKASVPKQATGYEVWVKKSGGSWAKKNAYIIGNEFIITGLSAKSKYYVKVRSYITDGGNVKHYSTYSKYVAVKTQKAMTLKTTTTKAKVGKSQIALSKVKEYSKTLDKNCVRMINYLRKDKGLGTLVWDETLYKVALERAKETTQCYKHTRPDGTSCFTISLTYDGENLVPRDNVYAAHIAWLNRPSHYENVVYPGFTRVAVAGVYSNGTYYFVTAFGY